MFQFLYINVIEFTTYKLLLYATFRDNNSIFLFKYIYCFNIIERKMSGVALFSYIVSHVIPRILSVSIFLKKNL
jgi:hypothetical protein